MENCAKMIDIEKPKPKFLAAMQPTFMPWMGYFALINSVDHFVFLDDVQLNRRSWQTRNRIKGNIEPLLLSLNLASRPSRPLINEAHLAPNGFEKKLIRTISNRLKAYPFGDLAMSIIAHGFDVCDGKLSKLNCTIIKKTCEVLELTSSIHLSSELPVRSDDKVKRHLELTKYCEADCYLSPIGSIEYFREGNLFQHSAKSLRFLNFNHPKYMQGSGAFVSHMSALEALSSVGPIEFLELLNLSTKKPLTLKEAMETNNAEF